MARGVYEVIKRDFEEGTPKWQAPVIIRGWLVKSEKHDTAWIYSRGAAVRVLWFMDAIPPDVRYGTRVTIAGDLITANRGAKVRIVDCVHIPKHTSLMEDLHNLMKKHSVPIGSYIAEPEDELAFIVREQH